MWPFILTRSINLQRKIKASKAEVLSIVQDPDEVLRLGPLVFSVIRDDKDPAWYTITDRLPILGGLYESTTTFQCKWANVEDGADVEVFAGVGTHMQNKMRVVDTDSEEEEVEFQEILVVQGLFCLMPYITSTITKTHIAMHDVLAGKVLEKKNATSASIDLPNILPPLIYLTVLFLTLALWFKMRFTDPYGLFHLTLNKLPSEDPNSPPLTEWLNMGYWKDTNIFPEACKALALKLIAAANLKGGGTVLDVGHGTGESLLLILSEPSIPRPYHLVGITSLDIHHQRSVERVQKYQSENGGPTTNVNLYHGDAVYDGVVSEHPFHSASKEVYDSILALDCAYHFHSRRLFLQQSFSKLGPGGRVALADICFDSSALKTRRTRVLTSTVKLMPAENLISDQEYIAQLEGIGFVDVSLEDITPDVFPGFVKFLKGRRWGWWMFASIINWYGHAGAKFVIVSGRKPSLG